METLQTITRLNQRQLEEIKMMFIRVVFVGFLDVIFRFSYVYLGLLSYVVRFVGFISLFIVPALPYNVLKIIFKYMAVIAYIVLAWILTSMFITKGETLEWTPPVLIILKLAQFFLVFTYYYTCNVNTGSRFLFYAYMFFVGGSLLQICPNWISYTLIIVSVCLAAIYIRMYNDNFRIFSEEQHRQIVSYFDSMENMQIDDTCISKALFRKEFVIYFAILLPMIFTFNVLVFNSDIDPDQWYWISTSTLGMCTSTIICVKTFAIFTTFICKQTMKLNYFLIKGEIISNTELLLSNKYLTITICVYLNTFDLFIYNMEQFERGVVLRGRILLLSGCLLQVNSMILQAVCLEPNIKRSNIRTILKVIGMHFCFGISSFLVLYKIMVLYSMLDLGILLTASIVFDNLIITIFSIFTFCLYRIDIMRHECWETFDDFIFYKSLIQSIIHISLHFGTAIYAVWTLYAGVYMWIDLFRLFSLCYVSIFLEIQLMKNKLQRRQQVVQFTSELDDASDIIIRENEYKCPICLQEMAKAKVTPCKHIFHDICLKKWLYCTLTCPMCKRDIQVEQKKA